MLKKPNLKLGIPATFQSVERTDTHAESCVVSGDGLKVAMIGEMASFRIEARDENGVRRKSGGDHFSSSSAARQRYAPRSPTIRTDRTASVEDLHLGQFYLR